MRLNASTSTSTTAKPVPSWRARAIAAAVRSMNSARLGSPVSASWVALWRSCAIAATRSLTSRPQDSRCVTRPSPSNSGRIDFSSW